MKRLTFKLVVAILLPFALFTSCEDIIGIFIGGNGAPVIIIYGDDNTPITNGTVSIGNGESFTITVNATDQDGDALTYKWLVDGQLQGTAISSTFTFSATPDTPTDYTIEVRVSDGSEVTSGFVTIRVDAAAPAVSISHSGSTVDFGSSITFTAVAVAGLDLDSLLYTWLVDGFVQNGESGSTFVYIAGSVATSVEISVEISDGSRTGDAATTINVVAPNVSISPNNGSVFSGDTTTLTATASPSFDTGSTTYTWSVDGVEQTGITGSTLSFTQTVTVSTVYDIEVTATDGTRSATTTTTITVTVASVTLSPSNPTLDFGDAINLFATVSGLSGTITYTWYDDGSYISWNDNYSDYYFYAPYYTTTIDVRVVASDGTRTVEDTVTITIAGLMPSISADRTPDDGYDYNEPVTITITSGTPGANIYYEITTSYISTVTTSSTPYAGPFTLEPTAGEYTLYVHALAESGGTTSTDYMSYSFGLATPVLTHATGTYYDSFTLNVVDPGSDTFRYSTGSYGSYPTETSPILNTGSGLPISTEGYYYVRRFRTGWPQSSYTGGWYSISVEAPVPDIAEGTFELADTTSMVIHLSSQTSDAVIYYTIDSSTPDDTDIPYNDTTGITITENTTIRAIAYSANIGSSASTSYLDYNLKAAAPVFSPLGGSYTTVQNVTMTSTTPGAVIRYNKSATAPSYITSGTGYTGPVMLDSDTTLTATAFLPGWSASDATSEVYDITVGAIGPEFIYRLNLSSLWTTADVTSDDGVWYIVTIETAGRYYFSFADTDQGDGTETLDGLVTMFESDRTTPLTYIDARDTNAYYSPVPVDLIAGDYYIRVYPVFSGNTGTVQIRIQ